jgi:hypothetical protein
MVHHFHEAAFSGTSCDGISCSQRFIAAGLRGIVATRFKLGFPDFRTSPLDANQTMAAARVITFQPFEKIGLIFMRMISLTICMIAGMTTTAASAQSINLTGAYRCVEVCRGGNVGNPTFITQNGPQLNILNEVGEASRAWPDWFAPATRIWVENYNYGAVYSPDGMLIQFDNGTIWQRDLGPPPPPQYRK